MTDLVLIGTMLVICAGIGWPLAALLPRARFVWRGLVAPALGIGALAIAAPVLYEQGVPTVWIFRGAGLAAIAILLLRARPLVRSVRAQPAAERKLTLLATAVGAIATSIMIAPRWTGGDQFAVFQGNHWDTHGYLESGIVYAREPYAFVSAATPEHMIRNPLLDSAQINWAARPSAHLLYGVFSRVMPGQAYRLYYAYLVGCYTQLVLVLLFVLRNLAPEASPRAWVAGALVFPLGFWGQYVLDINAWSHMAANPLLLLMTGLLLHAAARPDPPEAPLGNNLRLAAAVAAAVAGSVYLYPEALLAFGAACWPIASVVLLVPMLRRRRFSWRAFVPLTGAVGIAAALPNALLMKHLVAQIAYGSSVKVEWWRFFQGFFVGRDGVAGGPAAFGTDFVAGLFGLYFATPMADAARFLAIGQRLAILLTIAALLVAVGLVVAGRASTVAGRVSAETRLQVAAWIGVWLVMWCLPVYLGFHANYWPAGKAISYAAPVFMTVLALPIGFELTSRALRPLGWITAGFVAFQLASGVGRIQAATHPLGIHYASPYPSVQGAGLKHFGWDFTRLEPVLTPDMKVLIAPMDVWQAHHLMVFLWCREIPFAPAQEVTRGFGAYGKLGTLPPPWTPDVEIRATAQSFVLHFRDGRPDVHVATGKVNR